MSVNPMRLLSVAGMALSLVVYFTLGAAEAAYCVGVAIYLRITAGDMFRTMSRDLFTDSHQEQRRQLDRRQSPGVGRRDYDRQHEGTYNPGEIIPRRLVRDRRVSDDQD